MPKLTNDKYFTPPDLAKQCINRILSLNLPITEWVEPSAGNGSFSLQVPGCLAYDLYPEHPSIVEQDFLTLELPYKEGRLFFGNPPFGESNNLSIQFMKKAKTMGDFIAFIQPVSQFDNNRSFFEFDLIHSEVLENVDFGGERPLMCCFNIYKRPANGMNTKKTSYVLNDVSVTENRRTDHKLKDVKMQVYQKNWESKLPDHYDIGIKTWGDPLGKEIEYPGQYCQEALITVHNEKYKQKVIDLIRTTDWYKVSPSISSSKLQLWRIQKYLKEKFPELN